MTAPRDEAFTPLKDEYGNAVSFNIKVGNNWLYERDGIKVGAIQLKNGESDRDFRIYFSLNPNIEEACIVWERAPETAIIGGTEPLVNPLCNKIIQSKLEPVYWEGVGPGSSGGSTRVSGGEVKPIGGFLR